MSPNPDPSKQAKEVTFIRNAKKVVAIFLNNKPAQQVLSKNT